MTITCKNPKCKKTFDVPGGQGKVMVACPHCGAKFMGDTGNVPDAPTPKPAPKPKVTPVSKPAPRPKVTPAPKPTPGPKVTPAPTPQPPVPPVKPDSTIRFWRPSHAYKEFNMTGLNNMAADKETYFIYVDNVEKGELKADDVLTLDISSMTGHILEVRRGALGLKLPAGKAVIPAGGGSYTFTAFNRNLWGGPVQDPFGDAVVQYMVQTYAGKTIQSWFHAANNARGSVGFSVHAKGVKFFYTLTETKGWKEWSTGKHEQELSYAQAGIHLPFPAGASDYGYWSYLEDRIREAVCMQLGYERHLGELRPATGPATL